jgi:hypothetical protein
MERCIIALAIVLVLCSHPYDADGMTKGEFSPYPGIVIIDHVLRELPLIVQWQGQCYGHIGLVIAACLSNTSFQEIYLAGRSLFFGSGRIPLKRGAKLKSIFGKKKIPYTHFHYSDLLEGKLKRDIQGKFVIMGFNATGMSDYVVTESSNRYPGSEVIASVIDHIMGNLGK